MNDPNISVNWNGVKHVAHASAGGKYGTGEGLTEDEARENAVADLAKAPTKTAPTTPVDHTTAKV